MCYEFHIVCVQVWYKRAVCFREKYWKKLPAAVEYKRDWQKRVITWVRSALRSSLVTRLRCTTKHTRSLASLVRFNFLSSWCFFLISSNVGDIHGSFGMGFCNFFEGIYSETMERKVFFQASQAISWFGESATIVFQSNLANAFVKPSTSAFA